MGSFFKFPAFTTLRILLSRFYCFYKTEFKTKKLLKILQKLFVLIGTHIRSRCVRMCKPTLLAPGHQLIRIRPTVGGLPPALSGPAFVADGAVLEVNKTSNMTVSFFCNCLFFQFFQVIFFLSGSH